MHRIVLENRDDAAWPENSNQVFEHLDRIGKALETLSAPDEVETLVWKRKPIEGGRDELDRSSSGARLGETDFTNAITASVGPGSKVTRGELEALERQRRCVRGRGTRRALSHRATRAVKRRPGHEKERR